MLSIAISIYLIASGDLKNIVIHLGKFGILGTFIAGFFFGYTFTIIPATASIIYFSQNFNFILVSLIGAIGTMFGNLLLFHLIKNELPDEIENFIEKDFLDKIKKIKIHWLVPGLAGLIIASPIPDEIAVALLGMSKFSTKKFMFLSFSLTFVGLLLITGAAKVL